MTAAQTVSLLVAKLVYQTVAYWALLLVEDWEVGKVDEKDLSRENMLAETTGKYLAVVLVDWKETTMVGLMAPSEEVDWVGMTECWMEFCVVAVMVYLLVALKEA